VCAVNRTPLNRFVRPLALVAVGALALVACGDDTSVAGSGTTAAVGAGNSTYGTGACAPADGSATKTQTFADAPQKCLKDGKAYVVTLTTDQGTLHITMRPDIAPVTVNSFVNLARFHYFDGTTCHRAIAGFVVQCGDPTASGSGGPGYSFQDELDKIEPYKIGSIAMANSGPNTNGSQFFIITGPQGAALPPQYNLFGQVADADLGVVAALDKLGNPADGPPLKPINITSVTVEEK
jgi:cyclophilin family peptidyl-prolyl cis-trans isomerase